MSGSRNVIIQSNCRVNERQGDPAVLTIDQKIGIERQHRVTLVHLGHPYDASVGERHRSIPILMMQLAQSCDMFVDLERDSKRAVFEKCK